MKLFVKKMFIIVMAIALTACGAVTVFADDYRGYIVVTDTVAVNSGEDVADMIQSLIDENPNRTIYFPDGEYLLSKPIYTPADPVKSVSLELSDFAVLKAIGDWESNTAIVQLGGKDPANDTATNGSNYSLEGGIIDGSGVANGVSINSGRETAIRNVSIKNTVVGIYIGYGANSGSSDSDIYGVNIIGTGKTDSVGIVLEGYDNTITNVRIGNVFTGVHIKSAGNALRNVHPLYYSDYTDYQNSCGFLDECGNNWYDYCYSDQFGIGFRTTSGGSNYYNDCYCFWYSAAGEKHVAFMADEDFNSTLTNFKAGFQSECENIVLVTGGRNGNGRIDNIEIQGPSDDNLYRRYDEEDSSMSTLLLILIIFVLAVQIAVVVLIVIRSQKRKKLSDCEAIDGNSKQE